MFRRKKDFNSSALQKLKYTQKNEITQKEDERKETEELRGKENHIINNPLASDDPCLTGNKRTLNDEDDEKKNDVKTNYNLVTKKGFKVPSSSNRNSATSYPSSHKINLKSSNNMSKGEIETENSHTNPAYKVYYFKKPKKKKNVYCDGILRITSKGNTSVLTLYSETGKDLDRKTLHNTSSISYTSGEVVEMIKHIVEVNELEETPLQRNEDRGSKKETTSLSVDAGINESSLETSSSNNYSIAVNKKGFKVPWPLYGPC